MPNDVSTACQDAAAIHHWTDESVLRFVSRLKVTETRPVECRPAEGNGFEVALYLSEGPNHETLARLASCSDRLAVIEAGLVALGL